MIYNYIDRKLINLKLPHKIEKSDDIKLEWNSNSNRHGSAEREVTKYINGSRVKITSEYDL